MGSGPGSWRLALGWSGWGQTWWVFREMAGVQPLGLVGSWAQGVPAEETSTRLRKHSQGTQHPAGKTALAAPTLDLPEIWVSVCGLKKPSTTCQQLSR